MGRPSARLPLRPRSRPPSLPTSSHARAASAPDPAPPRSYTQRTRRPRAGPPLRPRSRPPPPHCFSASEPAPPRLAPASFLHPAPAGGPRALPRPLPALGRLRAPPPLCRSRPPRIAPAAPGPRQPRAAAGTSAPAPLAAAAPRGLRGLGGDLVLRAAWVHGPPNRAGASKLQTRREPPSGTWRRSPRRAREVRSADVPLAQWLERWSYEP